MKELTGQMEVEISRRSGNHISGTLASGEPFEREMTATEVALESALSALITADTHGAWHRFQAEVLEAGSDNNERAELAEAFAERHPGWVELASCDNDRFMSSDLVLVRHGTGANHMGTSLVYLSQGDAEPVELFLYPGHASSLMRGLRASEPTLSGVALPTDAPASPEQLTEQFVAHFQRKPSPFDFFRQRWREKPWYAEMGHTEQLEALAAGDVPREEAEGRSGGAGRSGGGL